MAINTQKFLPLANSSSAIVKSAGSNISTKSSKGGAIIKQKKLNIKKFIPPEKQEEDNKEEKYGAIIKSLVSIDKFLKSGLVGDKKTFESEKQEKKEEKSKEKEKKLETKEKPKGLSGGISLPKFDFLESVKKYFLFTFLGWLFANTQQYLPQLMKIVDIIKPVISVAEFIFKGLLEGFIAFIDLGYNAYDRVRSVVKDLGGEGAEKTFDELSKNLNTLITTTILVAGALATLGGKQKPPGTPSPKGGTPTPPKPGVPRSLTGKPIPTTSGGRTTGRPDIRNPLRDRPKVTTTGGRTSGTPDIRNPVRTKPTVTASGGKPAAGRFAGKGLGKLAVRSAPIIGPLLDFGIRTLIFKESPGRAAAGAIGLGVGQALGGLIGGSIGGIVGSVVPIAGTFLGGSAGVFIGQLIGGFIGDWIGTSLYDTVLTKKDRKVQKKEKGGKVSGKRKSQGRSRRTIKVAPRKPVKLPPQRTQPGKDIGGEKQIRILYPDPDKKMSLNEFLRSSIGQGSYTYVQYEKDIKNKKPNPYKALTSTAKILKEIPFVGGLMGAAVDIALGQKPDKNVYKSLSSGIGYLVESLANQKANTSMSSLMRDIRGFADGGYISPSRELKGIDDTSKTGDMVAKLLGPTIDQRVNEAIQSIDKELQKKKMKEGGDTDGGGAGPGGGGGGARPGAGPDGLPLYGGPGIEGLSDFIAKAETGGRWNAYNGDWREGKKGDNAILSSKLTELRSYMNNNYPNSSGAVGAYQFMPETAISYARQLGLDPSKTVFSPEIQRKLNIKHLRDLGYDDYAAGKITRDQYGKKIAQQYRAVPDPTTGFTYSDSASSRNKATVSLQDYNNALDSAKQKAQPIATSPGKIPKADYIKGVLDESGEPGFDVTWKGDNNIAVLPGRVKEVGPLYGSGYGNVVVVESVDPVTGKKVDVMYAHFPNGGISVREGQQVSSGQVLGRMGKEGERGIGNIDGQHASIDFYEPNTRRGQITGRYSRWDGLSREIISSAQSGNNPSNWPKPQAQQPLKQPQFTSFRQIGDAISKLKPKQTLTVDGVGKVTKNENGVPIYYVGDKQVSATEFKSEFDKKPQAQQPSGQPPRPGQQATPSQQSIIQAVSKKGAIPITVKGQTYYFQAKPDGTYEVWKPGFMGSKQNIDVSGSKNAPIKKLIQEKINSMYRTGSAKPGPVPAANLPGRFSGNIIEELRRRGSLQQNMQGGGLISPSKPSIPNVGKSAYYEEQGSTIVFVPFETKIMVPVPVKSSSGSLMFPSSSLNTKDTYPSHSLSRG